MTALALTLTDAGRAALIDAAAGGTRRVRIVQVGLSATVVAVSPALIELPGEFRRLDAVSGQAIDARTIHLTARDDSDAAYDVRTLGIYLDDGTLFAVYGQPDAIFGKAPVSTFFLAVDVRMLAGQAGLIQFGATDFLNPPASETVKGVAMFASQAEVLAGAVADRIVSPAALARLLENFVAEARLATPGGVATLGLDGKLASAQRPPLDLIDVFPVNSQGAMLALSGAGVGDIAVRGDTGLLYILQASPPSVLGNWIQLNTPAPVSSVAGKTGNVALVAGDVGAVPTARRIGGTGLVTGGGALDADRALDVAVATPAEADAAQIATKALAPSSIVGIVERLAASVPVARRIGGSGLVTGGGTLDGDRRLDVTAATPEDLRAAAAGDRAITPASFGGLLRSLTPNGFYELPGGFLIQWVAYRGIISGEPAIPIRWPMAFPNAPLVGSATAWLASPSKYRDLWAQLVAPTTTGCTVQLQGDDGDDNRLDGFDVIMLGY